MAKINLSTGARIKNQNKLDTYALTLCNAKLYKYLLKEKI